MAGLATLVDAGPFCAGLLVAASIGCLSLMEAAAMAWTMSFLPAASASAGFCSGAGPGGLMMGIGFTAGTVTGTGLAFASLLLPAGCLRLASDSDLIGAGFTSCALAVRGRDAVPLALAADDSVAIEQEC